MIHLKVHISNFQGTFSVASLLIGAVRDAYVPQIEPLVDKLNGNNGSVFKTNVSATTLHPIEVVTSLTMLVGIIQVTFNLHLCAVLFYYLFVLTNCLGKRSVLIRAQFYVHRDSSHRKIMNSITY